MWKAMTGLVVLLAASTVCAEDRNLARRFGLGSLEMISDKAGEEVRGAGFGARSTSLATIAGVIFDPETSSRVNIDANNYGYAIDGNGSMYDRAAAESSVVSAVQGFKFTVSRDSGSTFTAELDAVSFGGGKGLILPTIVPGPYILD
jgi:hypothetical protein